MRLGFGLADRPSIERFLREIHKAQAPAGLLVARDRRGSAGVLLEGYPAWVKATPVPPHVNGNSPDEPCPLGCRNGWLEDASNDHRPYPCSHCQPDHQNGRPT